MYQVHFFCYYLYGDFMNKINIYCGRKFHFDYLNENYINKAKEDYRAMLLNDVNLLLNKGDKVLLNNNIEYIGPFYFESDGMIDKNIVDIEQNMLKNCDVAIFLLEDGLCPGSISELTYVSTLKKKTYVFYIKSKENEETESTLRSPCWFPMILCKNINDNLTITACKDYKEATSKIIKLIASNFAFLE